MRLGLRCNLQFPHWSSDPAGSFCHQSLDPPRGSIEKPSCEINPFLPFPSTLKWTASLTDSGRSPHYLQADWFSISSQGISHEMAISSILRAPTKSKELGGNQDVTYHSGSLLNPLLPWWICSLSSCCSDPQHHHPNPFNPVQAGGTSAVGLWLLGRPLLTDIRVWVCCWVALPVQRQRASGSGLRRQDRPPNRRRWRGHSGLGCPAPAGECIPTPAESWSPSLGVVHLYGLPAVSCCSGDHGARGCRWGVTL